MENQIISLDLTVNQINVILTGLAKLPIEMALDTFNKVQQQAQSKLGPPVSGPLAGELPTD